LLPVTRQGDNQGAEDYFPLSQSVPAMALRRDFYMGSLDDDSKNNATAINDKLM